MRLEIVESDDFKWNDYAAADFISKSDVKASLAKAETTSVAKK
jgi:hypothetical protein